MADLTTVDSTSDLAANYGQTVRLVGKYYVQDLGGHAIIVKRSDGGVSRQRRAAFLLLKGKASVSLASRSEAEMQALDGKRVAAVGSLRAPRAPGSRTVAQPKPMPSLVDIQSAEPYDESE